jgi:hypothetical protein
MVISGYFRLDYYWLWTVIGGAIFLMAIGGYSIIGYWWLLMAIGGYVLLF